MSSYNHTETEYEKQIRCQMRDKERLQRALGNEDSIYNNRFQEFKENNINQSNKEIPQNKEYFSQQPDKDAKKEKQQKYKEELDKIIHEKNNQKKYNNQIQKEVFYDKFGNNQYQRQIKNEEQVQNYSPLKDQKIEHLGEDSMHQYADQVFKQILQQNTHMDPDLHQKKIEEIKKQQLREDLTKQIEEKQRKKQEEKFKQQMGDDHFLPPRAQTQQQPRVINNEPRGEQIEERAQSHYNQIRQNHKKSSITDLGDNQKKIQEEQKKQYAAELILQMQDKEKRKQQEKERNKKQELKDEIRLETQYKQQTPLMTQRMPPTTKIDNPTPLMTQRIPKPDSYLESYQKLEKRLPSNEKQFNEPLNLSKQDVQNSNYDSQINQPKYYPNNTQQVQQPMDMNFQNQLQQQMYMQFLQTQQMMGFMNPYMSPPGQLNTIMNPMNQMNPMNMYNNMQELDVFKQIVQEKQKVNQIEMECNNLIEQYKSRMQQALIEKNEFEQQIQQLQQQLEIKTGSRYDPKLLNQVFINTLQNEKQQIFQNQNKIINDNQFNIKKQLNKNPNYRQLIQQNPEMEDRVMRNSSIQFLFLNQDNKVQNMITNNQNIQQMLLTNTNIFLNQGQSMLQSKLSKKPVQNVQKKKDHSNLFEQSLPGESDYILIKNSKQALENSFLRDIEILKKLNQKPPQVHKQQPKQEDHHREQQKNQNKEQQKMYTFQDNYKQQPKQEDHFYEQPKQEDYINYLPQDHKEDYINYLPQDQNNITVETQQSIIGTQEIQQGSKINIPIGLETQLIKTADYFKMFQEHIQFGENGERLSKYARDIKNESSPEVSDEEVSQLEEVKEEEVQELQEIIFQPPQEKSLLLEDDLNQYSIQKFIQSNENQEEQKKDRKIVLKSQDYEDNMSYNTHNSTKSIDKKFKKPKTVDIFNKFKKTETDFHSASKYSVQREQSTAYNHNPLNSVNQTNVQKEKSEIIINRLDNFLNNIEVYYENEKEESYDPLKNFDFSQKQSEIEDSQTHQPMFYEQHVVQKSNQNYSSRQWWSNANEEVGEEENVYYPEGEYIEEGEEEGGLQDQEEDGVEQSGQGEEELENDSDNEYYDYDNQY